MSKANRDVPELTDEELAFEMIEISCEEMDSLSKAFTMIAELCQELNGETDTDSQTDDDAEVHDTPTEGDFH